MGCHHDSYTKVRTTNNFTHPSGLEHTGGGGGERGEVRATLPDVPQGLSPLPDHSPQQSPPCEHTAVKWNRHICTSTAICTHARTYARTHAHTHTRTHTHTQTHMHTRTHTHTRRHHTTNTTRTAQDKSCWTKMKQDRLSILQEHTIK